MKFLVEINNESEKYRILCLFIGCWVGWMMVVIWDCLFGVVIDIVLGLLVCILILYLGGRNVLKFIISLGCFLNSDDILLMIFGVLMLKIKCIYRNLVIC